jgi:hypothetical protein
MRKFHPHQEIAGLSGLTLEDFWIWAYSDLLTSFTRTALAEFMVGFALGRLQTPRTDDTAGMFLYREKRIEARAASYTQSLEQQKKSKINFDVSIRKAKKSTEKLPSGVLRPSDCYVFCLCTFDDYNDKDAARNAMMNTVYWDFYVVPTRLIDKELGKQKTCGVSWLKMHTEGGATKFDVLKKRLDYTLGFAT